MKIIENNDNWKVMLDVIDKVVKRKKEDSEVDEILIEKNDLVERIKKKVIYSCEKDVETKTFGAWIKENGEKAKANQMRARCGHYPEMFEALPGNYIKLKEEDK